MLPYGRVQIPERHGKRGFSSLVFEDRLVGKDSGNGKFEQHTVSGVEAAAAAAVRFVNQGLFVSRGKSKTEPAGSVEMPTPGEIEEAEKTYESFCREIIREADNSYSVRRDASLIGEEHRSAAKHLGETPPWLQEAGAGRKNCPLCKESIAADASFCRFCRNDISKAGLEALEALRGEVPLPSTAPSVACPFCLEPILVGAKKCKHCQSDLGAGAPAAAAPVPPPVAKPTAPAAPRP